MIPNVLLSTLGDPPPIVIPPPAGENLNGWDKNDPTNFTISTPAHEHEVSITWEGPFADVEVYSQGDYGTASITYDLTYSDGRPGATVGPFTLAVDGDLSSYDPPGYEVVQTITITLVADGEPAPVFTVARP